MDDKNNSVNSRGRLKKLSGNVIVFTIGSFASKLMNYFFLPFYTAVLTQQEYGIYDIVITTSNLLFPLFSLLITESTMRFSLDQDVDSKKAFSLSTIVIGAGLFAYIAVSPLILLSQSYRAYYPYFVIYQFLMSVHTLLAQFSKGIQKLKEYATSGIISTAVNISCNILLMVVLKWGLTGYFISSFMGLTVSSIYLLLKCEMFNSFVRIKKDDFLLLKDMLAYSIPLMPNAVSWWISTSSDKYMITFYSGQSEMGLYSAAYKIPSLMTVFSSIFLNAWNISVVEDFGSKQSNEFMLKVYNFFFAILVLISAGIVLLVKLVVKLIFAPPFFQAWIFVPILVVAYVFHDLAAYVGSIYTASKNTKIIFQSTIVGAAVNIILNFLVIPKVGALGGSFTTLVSYVLIWIIRLANIKKTVDLKFNLKKDCVSLVLLLLEMYVVVKEMTYASAISSFLVLLLLLINGKYVVEAICVLAKNRGR